MEGFVGSELVMSEICCVSDLYNVRSIYLVGDSGAEGWGELRNNILSGIKIITYVIQAALIKIILSCVDASGLLISEAVGSALF